MTTHEIFVSQLLDPFRVGLLIVLLVTTRNTAAQTGILLPLLAGIVFVAVLIPLTFASDAQNWWTLVGVGLFTNSLVVSVGLLAWLAYERFAQGGDDNRS